MPHYKLVASGRRPDLNADEIIFERHEDSGEPKHMLSLHNAHEVPDELVDKARNFAYRLGFRMIEVEAPEEDSEQDEQDQPVGADAAGQAPVVSPTGESGAEIDQQETAKQGARANEQAGAGATTTGSGTPATAQTTQGGTPGSSATTSTPPPANS